MNRDNNSSTTKCPLCGENHSLSKCPRWTWTGVGRVGIIRMARGAGVSIRGHYDETGSTPAELERFAALVAAAEREACAKVCEKWGAWNDVAQDCAVAIRARGEK